ncbi:MAG TPA: hypothetical protein VMB21_13730, partial [Candidatus Limnocylindria bacterium]|nr:hypothetical protein [Candidatus Limnocylindria bacterium]
VIRLLCLLFPLGCLHAADIIDPTFRAGIPPITRGPDGPVYAMDQFPDGRIVIAGDFARVDGVRRHAIARLLPDGSLDTTFDAGTGPDDDIRSVVALADGRVLVGGRFQNWGSEAAADHVVRLKADGTIDHDFASTPRWDGEVTQLLLRADGSLMVLERLAEPIGLRTSLRHRFANGFLDGGFTPAIADGTVLNALALATNGDLLIAGRFTQFDHQAVTNLVRLKSDLTVDTTFVVPSGAGADALFSLAVANDGRVALGGAITNGFARAFLVMLRPDGEPDPQFAPARPPTGLVDRLSFDVTGALAVVEKYPYFAINSRFSPQGDSLDVVPAFPTLQGAAPLRLADGGTLWAVQGVVTDLSWLARTWPNGSLDYQFNPGMETDADDALRWQINTVAAFPEGDAFVLGTYGPKTNAGTVTYGFNLVRVDATGTTHSLTNSIVPESNFASRPSRMLRGIGRQVYVAGGFSQINGDTGFPWLARLREDGSLDTAFKPGFPKPVSPTDAHEFYDLVQLGDGRLYAGGWVRVPPGQYTGELLLARFMPDGTLDSSFVPLQPPFSGGDQSSGVFSLVALDDDHVLFWGQPGRSSSAEAAFYTYAATTRSIPTPTPDPGPSLQGDTGSSLDVSRLVRLSDGRVLVAGSFTRIAGVARRSLAVLRPDLSVDPGFDVGAGANSGISTAIQLTDGRILVAGAFTQWNGQSHRRLVLLQPDGRLDETFDIGTGPDDVPYELIEQPDGRVLIGGRFANLDGRGPARIARLMIPPSVPPVPAQLTLQPRTVISTNLAVPIILKAAALGTAPLHYQWFRRGVALMEADGYPGFNSPELVIQGTNLLATADYHVEVVNDSGRERSATVLAGLASGSMDFGFTTNLTGQIRIGGVSFGQPAVTVMAADTGPDGKARRILLIGNFTTYDQVTVPGLVVIHPDGSREASWVPPAGLTGANTLTAAFLPDGRLVLAGKFGRAQGAPRDAVIRLNQDGTLDDSFDPGDELAVTPPSGFFKQTIVNALALDVGGLFISSPTNGGTSSISVRRLQSDGKTDTGFLATNLNFSGTLSVLAAESGAEHGLLVSGNQFKAETRKHDSGFFVTMVRLRPDGRLDTNYNARLRHAMISQAANVNTLLPTPDGGVLQAGIIPEFDNAPGPVVRLDSLGQADTNFFAHLPASPLLPYANKQLQGLARLPNGTFLLNFVPKAGAPDSVLLLESDGTVVETTGGPVEGYRTST